MSYHAILEYIQELSKIYFQASKQEKSDLLDHAIKITKYNRKSLIRRLKGVQNSENGKTKCGRKPKYPHDLLYPHIKFLWEQMDRITAKRMKAGYEDWLPKYNQNGVNNRIKYLLEKMSVSTLERFLKKIRKYESKKAKGISSTSPARHMKNKVPINTLDSTISTVGYTQADTVAHCGTRLEGEFIYSITLTDIVSTWTTNRAVYSKRGPVVNQAMRRMNKIIPYDMIAINTDSGSEFLNMSVFNMLKGSNIIFTRSRPYKKNDNCYVEQKNYTHVRELFGYQRFDDKDLVPLMNEIYEHYWNPLQNFFIPTFKLKEKIRVGAKIKKIYDKPETPFHRLMKSNSLTEEQKRQLLKIKKGLNPFELKEGLEKKLERFFDIARKLDELNKRNSL